MLVKKNLSLKYQRFTQSCCKGIRVGKFDFVARAQFLSFIYFNIQQLIKLNRNRIQQIYMHIYKEVKLSKVRFIFETT